MITLDRRRTFGGASGLPYDAEIEYLQSSGTQYIDTLLYGNQNTAIEVDFDSQNTSNVTYTLAGSRVGTDNVTCINLAYNPKASVQQRFDSCYTAIQGKSGRHIWYIDKDRIREDGIDISTWSSSNFTTPETICVFYGRNNYIISAKIYSFKLWQGGVLTMDLIPVRVGQVGYMYDKVGGGLYGNVGTGDFVLGADLTGYDYERQYLTLESLEDNNVIGFNAKSANTLKTISVSVDNGKTWVAKTSSTDTTALATLNKGEKLLVRGSNTSYGTSESVYNRFTSTGNFNAYGNIQSLRFGDAFIGENSVTSQFALALFYYASKLKSAEDLIFPTGTNTYCYQFMFKGCSGLTKAPQILPATGLSMQCYHQMFYYCSNLLESPIICANNLDSGLYGCNQMFGYCSVLSKITCLAKTYPANSYYTSGWVQGVAATGTFVKNALATNWPTGQHGIPSGWTVVDAPTS